MYHRILAEFPRSESNQAVRRQYDMTLTMRGRSEVLSATAETVGVPVGVTAQVVLNGGLEGERGLVSPTSKKIYDPVLRTLETKYGIVMRRTVTETPLVVRRFARRSKL